MTSKAKPPNTSLIEIRCAIAIVREDAVLLLHRPGRGDWVLPGGRPRPRESIESCVQREAREETGLDIHAVGCALIAEINNPRSRRQILELVFVADRFDANTPLIGERGRWPLWVSWEDLETVKLRPPIAEFLRDLSQPDGKCARYLGNLWRPSLRI